jgi:hydroxyacylglutathione hydrolase
MLTVQCFTFNPVGENTYVVYNEKREACIIDPGCYFASEEAELKAFIEKNALQPVYLLNTHCHLDHIFGNKYVHRSFGLELHLHSLEKQVLDFGPLSGERWGLPFENYEGPLHYLEEGSVVKLGDDELKVLFTPGHSPGSISFYSAAYGFVIAGDVLFNGSVGRTDLPGGDFSVLEKSIREKLYTLPDQTVVYSGHGPATTVGKEKRGNAFVKG